jgi:membrane-bound ClpP family serine protease
MGANRQQGWALLLFIVGFTFLVAGLFALGPIFSIAGLVCLVASAMWCYRIKPLEHEGTEAVAAEPVSMPPRKRQAV